MAPKAAAKGAAPAAVAGKAKAPIKTSAKAALELLEAKVAEVKTKGKRGRGGRRGGKDAWLIPAELPKEDAETRRTRLKNLIKLGKERGFLTYAEINDHLPDDLVDAEQIEAIISTFGDMGIQVYDQAPDQETLLIASDAQPVAQPDEDVEEQAEAALSTVDSEFGRTTDPVRMYMREMGSVELLTREGEIEIAKRIEDGLRHMIQAISACPTTVQEILDLADKVEKDELRIDEVVDGLIDPNAKDDFDPKKAAADAGGRRGADRGGRGRGGRGSRRGRAVREPAEAQGRGAGEVHAHPPPVRQAAARRSRTRAPRTRTTCAPASRSPTELMTIRFTARTVERLSDSVRSLVDEIRRHEREIHDISRGEGADAAPALHQGVPGTEGSKRWLATEINAEQPWTEALRRVEPSMLELLVQDPGGAAEDRHPDART